MNPSSGFDFGGNLSPGFSSSSPSNANFSCNTPSLQRPPGGRAKPRFVKLRKQASPNILKSPGNLETRIGPGFNPFLVPQSDPSDASDLGWNLEEGVIKNMRDLRIEKRGSFGDQSFVSKLPDDMKQLNIGDVAKGNLSNENDCNVGTSGSKGVETEKLQHELQSKLNIKGSENINDGSKKGYAFKGSGESGDSMVGSSMDVLPDRIRNLNIQGSDGSSTNERDAFVFGSSKSTSHIDREREEVLLTEVERKLNIASVMGDSVGVTDRGFSSSQVFGKDEQNVKSGKSIHKETTFQMATMGLNPSDKVPMDQIKHETRPFEPTAFRNLFSSTNKHIAPGANVFSVTSDKPGNKEGFSFTAKKDGMETPFDELETPKLQKNPFSGLNESIEFSAKREASPSTQVKKRKGKLRQPIPVHLWHGKDFISTNTAAQDNAEASESYSPMDDSPYQETLAETLRSRESSVASDMSFGIDSKIASSVSQAAASDDMIDEDLVAATQHMNINGAEERDEETKEEDDGNTFNEAVGARAREEGSASGAETGSFISAADGVVDSSDIALISAETEVSSGSNIEKQDGDAQMHFSSSSNPARTTGFGFTFAASSSAQGQVLSSKRHQKKKLLSKIALDSPNSPLNVKIPCTPFPVQFPPNSGASLHLYPGVDQQADVSTLQSKVIEQSVLEKEPMVKLEPNLIDASTAAKESCEKWRLRGNQAYANGDSSKAEEYYTQGIECMPAIETSRSCLRALMLCYSNRAATRMSLGQMRDALMDCMMAVRIDPNFSRVQLRVANCYLALGEVENALRYFRKCLQSGSDICVDRKIAVEASDGLRNAQKLSECMQRCSELLQRRTSDDAESALDVIAEGMQISSYSEKLLEMKAKALFILEKYEEVIQLCEQTYDSAEKNCLSFDSTKQLGNLDGSGFSKDFNFRIWRCHLILKSYFYLGKLEEAIASLEKQEELHCNADSLESSIPLAATIRELLRHKAAGNEAFQSKRHSEAIEHYTAALSCSMESRPFTAICFCNRAAAYKAVGQVTDAIADCSLAIALDGNYMKAISRRATLYEMIRDYDQAASDLERLISLLKKRMEMKTIQIRPTDRSMNWANDLRQACLWLSEMKEESKKEVSLNLYLILGVEPSVSAAEIKKAYRKAALRHHPDKAVQSLIRSENEDERLWKEIREEAYKDAEKLFKMIGVAYAVLSDPTKRSKYGLEEEARITQKKRTGSTSRTTTDAQNYSTDRHGSRPPWREPWRSYGHSGSETNQPNRYR